jgi:hypothetical protein
LILSLMYRCNGRLCAFHDDGPCYPFYRVFSHDVCVLAEETVCIF